MQWIETADEGELDARAAEIVVGKLNDLLKTKREVTLTLAGGSTPKGLYSLLSGPRSGDVPWERVHLLWGDERAVPSDSPLSNYHLARENLITGIPIPESNIHRMHGGLGAADGARAYDKELRDLLGAHPTLDVVLLGMGGDGHTASLFPRSPQLHARGLVAATPAASLEPHVERITMTYELLNTAELVLFLVSGVAKQPVLREVRNGSKAYPCAGIEPRGTLVWLVTPPLGAH